MQLPDNEVTLSAYTIPDEKATNEHYNYVWTLVNQPKGGFTGKSLTFKNYNTVYFYFKKLIFYTYTSVKHRFGIRICTKVYKNCSKTQLHKPVAVDYGLEVR